MSTNKTLVIFLALFQTPLHAPRSLRNSPPETGVIEQKEMVMGSKKSLSPEPRKAKAAASSMDWTVTTTQELTCNIQYIKQTLFPATPGKELSGEKKELFKSLEAKEKKTKEIIKQAKHKGDSAYNQASFSVNRLAMAVNWYKCALELLDNKLEQIGTNKNLSFTQFKALESKTKETLFYEVYASACSQYPEPNAKPSTRELGAIIDQVIEQQFSDHTKPHKTLSKESSFSMSEQAQSIDPSGRLWGELKSLKTQQVEQSIAHKQNIQQLQKDLAIAQKSLAEHKNALERASSESKALTQKVEKASAERLEKSIEVAGLEKRIQSLEKSHKIATEKLNIEIQRLAKEVEDREKKISKLAEQRTKYESKLKDLEEQLTKFKQDSLAHTIELKSARDQKEKAFHALQIQKDSIAKKLAQNSEAQLAREKEVLLKQIKIQKLEKELKQKQIELTEKKLSLTPADHPTPSAPTQSPSVTAQAQPAPIASPAVAQPATPIIPAPVVSAPVPTPIVKPIITPTPTAVPVTTPSPTPSAPVAPFAAPAQTTPPAILPTTAPKPESPKPSVPASMPAIGLPTPPIKPEAGPSSSKSPAPAKSESLFYNV